MFVPKLVVRLVSILVPVSRREQWIAEWGAELEHEWNAALRKGERAGLVRIRLVVRAIESVPDSARQTRSTYAHGLTCPRRRRT